MQNHDTTRGSSLMFVIVNQGKAEKVIDFLLKAGVRGATAFLAHGNAPGHFLKVLEIADVRKEVILVALPAVNEREIVDKLVDHFHFDRPNHGAVFTVRLAGVHGSRHFRQNQSPDLTVESRSDLQAILAIANKGRAEDVLDYMEDHGLPRGVIIDAHGSADQSRKFMDLMLESEKDMILTVTTKEQTCRLVDLLSGCLDLGSPNSGILSVLNLQRAAGITLTLQMGLKDCSAALSENRPGYAAIMAIVENDREGAVIRSAEAAGSTGGTIIHARGTTAYHNKNFLSRGVEEEREVVVIVVPDSIAATVGQRISDDLELEKPNNGILFIMPLYDTVGLTSEE